MEDNINLFFQLLPIAIVIFDLKNHHNYRNGCTAMLLQWLQWNREAHPCLHILQHHFRACSEEYGETAIHTLMTHVREWNYDGPNLTARWRESGAAKWAFQELGAPPSHKSSGTKVYYQNGGDELMHRLSLAFMDVVRDANLEELEALIGDPGFSTDSARTDELDQWTELPLLYRMNFDHVATQVRRLEGKLRKPLDADAMHQVDLDLFFQ